VLRYERGDGPGALRTAGGEQGEDRQAADAGQYHQRQRAATEAGIQRPSRKRRPGHDGPLPPSSPPLAAPALDLSNGLGPIAFVGVLLPYARRLR
jgi:hypothetical protein